MTQWLVCTSLILATFSWVPLWSVLGDHFRPGKTSLINKRSFDSTQSIILSQTNTTLIKRPQLVIVCKDNPILNNPKRDKSPWALQRGNVFFRAFRKRSENCRIPDSPLSNLLFLSKHRHVSVFSRDKKNALLLEFLKHETSGKRIALIA